MRRVFIAIGLVFIFLVGTNLQVPAQKIHGCVSKRDGKLRVVSGPDECNTKKETYLYWNQTGPQGEPGQPGDPGAPGPEDPPGQGCIKVKSADDELIGTLVDFTTLTYDPYMDPNITVFIPSLGKFIQLGMEGWDGVNCYIPHHSSYWSVDKVYFESPDCAGTPHIELRTKAELTLVNNFVVTYKHIGGSNAQHYLISKSSTRIEGLSQDIGNDTCDPCAPGECMSDYYLTDLSLPFSYDVTDWAKGVKTPFLFE